MSFLSPLFLIGAAAAAIPIVLHLLKRRPDAKVLFSAVHLLRHAPIEHAARRRLRELLLLALRVTALVLLALAFARPFFASAADLGATGTTMVLLDTSLSMSAPGVMERARTLARQAIDAAPSGHAVGVLVFNDRAEIVERPTNTRARAVAAVNAAQPGAGATQYRGALAAAAAWLRGGDDRLVVVSDLQASGWDEGESASIPESARIEVLDVGTPPANLAITRLAAEGQRVTGTVINTGPAAIDARVSLRAGRDVAGDSTGSGVVADLQVGQDNGISTVVNLAAGQSAEFSMPRPDGQWASATVDDSTGAALDNTRYVILAAQARPSVLVVTASGNLDRDGFYVQQALAAAGASGSAYQVDGIAGPALQQWDQARLDRYQAVIVLSTRALEHHGRQLLASYFTKGGGVLVAAGADMDGDVVTEAMGGLHVTIAPPSRSERPVAQRTLAPEDARHPVLRPFSGRSSLSLVAFREIASVRAADCRILARFTTGEPAMFDCAKASGRMLLLAFDLNNSGNDFPVHATFLPFLHEAVRYVAGRERAAEVLVASAPAGRRTPGVMMAPNPDGSPRPVAVNFDPAEADATRLTVEEFQAGTQRQTVPLAAPRSENQDVEERQRLWRYALMAVLALLVVESMVAAKAA